MTFPIQQHYRLSTEYNEARPLSQPAHKRTHPHGAWDCACPVGTPILCPESGTLGCYVAYRPKAGVYWKKGRYLREDYRPFRNYFYDTFGFLYILWGDSGLVHVFAHSYHPDGSHHVDVVEEQPSQHGRWPLIGYQGHYRTIQERNLIGLVGNAGWSTGPHLHYEIHNNPWERWEDRPDPAELYKAEWEEHKDDLGYDWRQARKLWSEE